MHSVFDGTGEERLVVPENLCTKNYVIGARNVGIFAGHYTLFVEPMPRQLGSLVNSVHHYLHHSAGLFRAAFKSH